MRICSLPSPAPRGHIPWLIASANYYITLTFAFVFRFPFLTLNFLPPSFTSEDPYDYIAPTPTQKNQESLPMARSLI